MERAEIKGGGGTSDHSVGYTVVSMRSSHLIRDALGGKKLFFLFLLSYVCKQRQSFVHACVRGLLFFFSGIFHSITIVVVVV